MVRHASTHHKKLEMIHWYDVLFPSWWNVSLYQQQMCTLGQVYKTIEVIRTIHKCFVWEKYCAVHLGNISDNLKWTKLIWRDDALLLAHMRPRSYPEIIILNTSVIKAKKICLNANMLRSSSAVVKFKMCAHYMWVFVWNRLQQDRCCAWQPNLSGCCIGTKMRLQHCALVR